jgi:dTDP-4-dehydrorhamnose 3,5-epimerase
MKAEQLRLAGLMLITPDVHADERGFFMETAQSDKFRDIGITDTFVQDNHSHSIQGVVRGLKYQFDKPTTKLVRVAYGEVVAVGLDIRPDSETFGEWERVVLSSENKQMLYVPFGFAFGFGVVSETAGVLYKLSALHNASGAGTINCLDSELAIDWGVREPIVTPQDLSAPTFKVWCAEGSQNNMRTASL